MQDRSARGEYYLEIGSAAHLLAFHGWVANGDQVRPTGVTIVAGWASDEPCQVLAQEVAHEWVGDHTLGDRLGGHSRSRRDPPRAGARRE